MGYTGPVNTNPASGDASVWEYGYVPSLPMGIVGCVSFILVSIPHLWWFIKKRGTRSVHGLFFFGGLIEALGYGARLSSHKYPFAGMSFLIQIVLIQTATFFATAALYKSVQRGLKYTPDSRQLSPMRPRSLITLFVILDVVWAVFQMAGAYFIGGAQSASETNADPMFALGTSSLIFLAGVVLQGLSIIIVTIFIIVIRRRSSRLINVTDPSVQLPLLLPLLNQIIICLCLFFVRLVMRIAEGAQGAYFYAWSHEWCFGVFEYLPIFLIWAIWAARPLYKFIFPFGHRHSEGAHTREGEIEAGSAESHQAAAVETKV